MRIMQKKVMASGNAMQIRKIDFLRKMEDIRQNLKKIEEQKDWKFFEVERARKERENRIKLNAVRKNLDIVRYKTEKNQFRNLVLKRQTADLELKRIYLYSALAEREIARFTPSPDSPDTTNNGDKSTKTLKDFEKFHRNLLRHARLRQAKVERQLQTVRAKLARSKDATTNAEYLGFGPKYFNMWKNSIIERKRKMEIDSKSTSKSNLEIEMKNLDNDYSVVIVKSEITIKYIKTETKVEKQEVEKVSEDGSGDQDQEGGSGIVSPEISDSMTVAIGPVDGSGDHADAVSEIKPDTQPTTVQPLSARLIIDMPLIAKLKPEPDLEHTPPAKEIEISSPGPIAEIPVESPKVAVGRPRPRMFSRFRHERKITFDVPNQNQISNNIPEEPITILPLLQPIPMKVKKVRFEISIAERVAKLKEMAALKIKDDVETKANALSAINLAFNSTDRETTAESSEFSFKTARRPIAGNVFRTGGRSLSFMSCRQPPSNLTLMSSGLDSQSQPIPISQISQSPEFPLKSINRANPSFFPQININTSGIPLKDDGTPRNTNTTNNYITKFPSL